MGRLPVVPDDLLVSDDARATWNLLSESERSALLAWVNKPWFDRARRERQREAIRALELGKAASGLAQIGVLESILTSLPWGT